MQLIYLSINNSTSRIHNEPEFDLFILAFRSTTQNLPADRIFLPLKEEGKYVKYTAQGLANLNFRL